MKKGVVIEQGKKWAIVLTPEGEFCKIRANGQWTEGEEIVFSTKDEQKTRFSIQKYGLVAAVVLLMIVYPLLNPLFFPIRLCLCRN